MKWKDSSTNEIDFIPHNLLIPDFCSESNRCHLMQCNWIFKSLRLISNIIIIWNVMSLIQWDGMKTMSNFINTTYTNNNWCWFILVIWVNVIWPVCFALFSANRLDSSFDLFIFTLTYCLNNLNTTIVHRILLLNQFPHKFPGFVLYTERSISLWCVTNCCWWRWHDCFW